MLMYNKKFKVWNIYSSYILIFKEVFNRAQKIDQIKFKSNKITKDDQFIIINNHIIINETTKINQAVGNLFHFKN